MDPPEELEGGRQLDLSAFILLNAKATEAYKKALDDFEAVIRKSQENGWPVDPEWLEVLKQGREYLAEIPKE